MYSALLRCIQSQNVLQALAEHAEFFFSKKCKIGLGFRTRRHIWVEFVVGSRCN